MLPIKDVITRYQPVLKGLYPDAPGGKHSMGRPGIINRQFINHLILNRQLFDNFMRHCHLIVSEAKCPRCDKNLTLSQRPQLSDRYYWRCGKKSAGNTCYGSKSVRENSWFSKSKLTMPEIFLLTYEIVKGYTADNLIDEYAFSSATVADWRQFVRELIVDYIELHSEKLGGPGKIVEVDESKFGKNKYHRGRPVQGQWVFGGVERDSGKIFLVAVHDRTSATLKSVIKEWVHKDTTIYTDCWKGYNDLDKEGFSHWTVNHSYYFVDPDTGVHTNTVESLWRHVKSNLPSYNRQSPFKLYLAEYLFNKSCAAMGICRFTKFLEIVRTQNWANWGEVVGSDSEDS